MSEISLFVDNKLFKEFSRIELFKYITFKRNIEKDILLKLESKAIEKKSISFWKYSNWGEAQSNILDFLKSQGQISDYPLRPFLTLPVINDNTSIDKLTRLWSIFYSQKYLEDAQSEFKYVNMPSGSLTPDIMFIGEAPGWKGSGSFNVPVYSYGKTSLLFRFLAFTIFGYNIWFSNISKTAIEKNSKTKFGPHMSYLQEEINILMPRTIIALGRDAYDVLLFMDLPMSVHRIYHPAYIFRQGNDIDLYRGNMIEVRDEISSIL
jgi:hypothetical protein